ncbi:MAG: hypothetical protein R3C15_20920 [Thermoleophilia bacterium]
MELARRLREAGGRPGAAAAADRLEELLERRRDKHALLLTTTLADEELAAVVQTIGEWILLTGQVPLQLATLHSAINAARRRA